MDINAAVFKVPANKIQDMFRLFGVFTLINHQLQPVMTLYPRKSQRNHLEFAWFDMFSVEELTNVCRKQETLRNPIEYIYLRLVVGSNIKLMGGGPALSLFPVKITSQQVN